MLSIVSEIWSQNVNDVSLPGLLMSLMSLVWAADAMHRVVTPDMLQLALSRYGSAGEQRIEHWGLFMATADALSEGEKLERTNAFFNREVQFRSDKELWQREDYWATPLESLGRQQGDCEDFVIAKYYTLLTLGVAEEKLRITYVKALKLNQAHMVLSYYATPGSEPVILDNLINTIERASKRTDLAPVYSLNSAGMWLERAKGGSLRVGDPNRLDMWADLKSRMQEQGMIFIQDVK